MISIQFHQFVRFNRNIKINIWFLSTLKIFKNNKSHFNWTIDRSIQYSPKIEFIYCARLLISKGIKIFLKLAEKFPEHDFIIFGAFDFPLETL